MIKTKIKSVTTIQRKQYVIGNYYSELLLDRIDDRSQEFPDETEFIYMGFTKDNALVFEIINIPAEVEYVIEKETETKY